MSESPSVSAHRSLFFTKQPILDAKRAIWGYELLGSEVREGIHEIFPQQESAASLASSTYLGLRESMERGKKIMVGFDDSSILEGMPYALPPLSGVVRLLPSPRLPTGIGEALEKLRSDGYQIVLEAGSSCKSVQSITGSSMDIIVFDLGKQIPAEESLETMRKSRTPLLARGIRTVEQFHEARDQGFSLFQGSFFKEPEAVHARKLGSNELSRLNLFKLIETEDPDFKALAATIRADVSISFRLLSYLNSAWFGLRQSIQSIDQAIRMLGWNKLKSWLRAVLLLDMAGSEEVPRELAALSLQRGKFFELLATDYDYWGFNPNTLFLMGLFSLMDAILGMPMESVAQLLPLDAKLKAALRRDANSEYLPLFRLLECLEDGDWPTLEALARKLCLEISTVKGSFAASRDWAGGFFAVQPA